MHGVRLIAGFALLVLTAAIAGAQQRAAQSNVPLYRVEMIFVRSANADRGQEDLLHNAPETPVPALLRLPRIDVETVPDLDSQPPLDGDDLDDVAQSPADPNPGTRLDLIEPDWGLPPLDVTESSGVPAGFRLMADDELTLRGEAADLRSVMLGYRGWIQQGIDERDAVDIDLKLLGITNPTGTVSAYISQRRWYVTVDLTYHEGSGTFWTPSQEIGLAPLERAQTYRLVGRTLPMTSASNQLHAIDHPLFQVLVLITPAPQPGGAADDDDGGPAA